MTLHELGKVSIHTPTKGVTHEIIFIFTQIKVSIHTPTKGVTNISISFNNFRICFNPHTHEGCDSR